MKKKRKLKTTRHSDIEIKTALFGIRMSKTTKGIIIFITLLTAATLIILNYKKETITTTNPDGTVVEQSTMTLRKKPQ